jgi:AcrR family transcriptional regulator
MTIPELSPSTAENILHAARQMFARKGYHGTSTKELARLADVAENTLFRHFRRKEDLFWAALRSSLRGLELRLDLLIAIAEDASPEIVIRQLFTQLVDAMILRPEMLRLIVIAFTELPGKVSAVLYEHLAPTVSTVNEYLAKSIESGKLRKVPPSLVTAAMISTAVGYPTFATLIADADVPYSDDREAVLACSRFWLEILTPIRPAPVRGAEQAAGAATVS